MISLQINWFYKIGSVFHQCKNRLQYSNKRKNLSIDMEVRKNIVLNLEFISGFILDKKSFK